MATMAFYDGRGAGRLGAPKTNPYHEDDPKHSDWEAGYREGEFLLRASDIELFRALKRLRNVMTGLGRLPAGYPEFWL